MAQINIQYTADIQQLNAKLDQIIQKQEQLISSSQKAGKEMSDAAKKSSEGIDFLNNSLQKLQGAVASAFAIGKIWEFTKSIVEAERSMELLQNRLNFIAGSSEGGAKMFQRLLAVSKDLGINVNSLAEGMASFGLAATQAGFSANKTERIFVQISSALRAAGASSLQSQRAFYALQQMMSKGVVAAEELRRQLAESLPAASEYMTEAYNRLHPAANLTNEEFSKLLESGKIISAEILPAFADVVEERLSPALSGKKNSLDAALQNAGTELTRLKLNLGNTAFIKGFVNLFSEQVERLNSTMESSLPTFQKLGIALGVLRGDISAQIAADSLKELQKSLSEIDAKKVDDIIEVSKEIMKLDTASRERKKEEYKQDLQAAQQIIDANANKVNSYKNEIAAAERAKEEKMKILEAEKMSVRDRFYKETEIQKEFLLQKRAIDKKYSLDDLQRQTTNAKDRLRIASGVLDEIKAAEKALQESRQRGAEEERQRQEQALKDAVALAKIRVEQALKGTIEESDARAELAKKQGDLDVFMAKSSAEAQLARVKAEVEANKQIEESRTRTAEVLSQEVVEEDVDMSGLKFQRKQLEQYAKDQDKILDAIADPFLNAQDLEIAAATKKYRELIALTKTDSTERKLLEEALQKELQNIRERYADKEAKDFDKKLKKYAQIASQVFSQFSSLINGFAEADRKIRENQLESELQALSTRFNTGVITEEEYQKRVNAIKAEQFKIDQDAAIAKIKMDTAAAIINLYAQLPFPAAALLTPVLAGLSIAQIDAVKSTPMPTFHEGGIDIGGTAKMTSGPLKSDEFIAKLQKGESVMTINETAKYKDVLSAIREDRLPALIAEKYILPAYKHSMDKAGHSDAGKSSLEIAFQTAELVGAIKNNKKIRIDNVDELSRAINKRSSMDGVIRRRSW